MADLKEFTINRLFHWQKGESRAPTRVTIFPTNICNIECKHCWQRWADYDKTYTSELSDERLLTLIDEGHEMGVREWYFVGGGDAMARGKLVIEMCEKIRALGMHGGIHTNGTIFKKGMFERLIDIEWKLVLVSLDGPNAEINDYIRSRGFEKATANLRRLCALKREREARWPGAGIYCTLTNLSYDKIDQFVELAADIGLDEGVNISGLIVEGPESAEFELSAEQKKALPEHVHKAIERADDLGVKNNFQAYLEEELIHDGMDMHRNFKPKNTVGISGAMCFEPWTSLSILPDGRVGPCCAFYDDDANSIKENSLADVWNGPYMTSVREGMLNGHPPDYCKRCPSNLYVVKERHRKTYSKDLIEQSQLDAANPARKVARLAVKGIKSIKKHGILKTVERGIEWRRIQSDL